jgi:hypothetical protein
MRAPPLTNLTNDSSVSSERAGILDRFAVSRGECDAIVLHARVKAGWIG